MPVVVPSTMEADTAMHVGEPKFLFPTSENAWPLSLFSFVHRTTSHGGEGVSVSPGSSRNWLVMDMLLLWPEKKAGDDGRGERRLGDDIRDWNRRSKGRNEGVGLLRPCREATDGRMLLLGDEITEPYIRELSEVSGSKRASGIPE
jgi:hypothetical protein